MPVHRSPLTVHRLPARPLSDFILALPILVFSLVAHEYAHARTALWQGDDTAYMLGRVTLNPLPHIDPIMTILVPALLWWKLGFMFGGAKPVPVVPRKYRSYVQGDLIVSSAGVITNFVLAFLCALLFLALYGIGAAFSGATEQVSILQRMMMLGIWLNLGLCFFNLIPIPPLDGSHLLYHMLPPAWGARYRQLGNFGFLPLMAVLFLVPAVANFFLLPARSIFFQLATWIAPFGIGAAWNITSG
jgi:Zn-dependent protease